MAERVENLHLMHWLDEQYTRCPYYGVLRMTAWLRQQGHAVKAKRVRRLLRQMGLMAVSQAASQPTGRGGAAVSLLTHGGENLAVGPSVVDGHHLRALVAGVGVSGGHHGLV